MSIGALHATSGVHTYQLRIRQDSSARWDIKEINAPLVATLELDQQIVATKRYSINARDVVKHFGYSVLAGFLLGKRRYRYCLVALVSEPRVSLPQLSRS